MRTADMINRQLVRKIKGRSEHWHSPSSVSRLLWCGFVGSTFWPQGFWNHHCNTLYLDVQIVESGILMVRTDSGSVTVPAGSTVLIPPGEFILEASSSGGVHKKHFGISGALCLQNLGRLGLEKITLLPNYPDPQFLLEFEHLRKLAEVRDAARIHDFSAQICKLMLMLSERAENRNLPQPLITAKSFMECAFADDLTLDDICQHSACGKTRLQNLFRKHFNTTPVKYLTGIRMKYAEQLLKEQDHPVKIIAGMCGYNNPLYFSNAFKKAAGCSPREFRRRHRENSQSDSLPWD